MAAQCSLKALIKIRNEADTLAEQWQSIADEIVADVRLPQGDARIAECFFFCLSRQSERLFRDFHLLAVRSPGDLRNTFPVQASAFDIHGGVCARRIEAQNALKRNERLEFFLPGSLRNVLKGDDPRNNLRG